MKILVMGAGGQGAPCASILSKDPEITYIKLCDIDEKMLIKVKDKINSPKLYIEKVDASDPNDVARVAEGMDAIIDLVTPSYFTNVMEGALKSGCHYVNTAWEEYLYEGYEENNVQLGQKLKYSDEFLEKKLTAILGCGMSSGYATNVIISNTVDKMETVESIKIRLAKKDTTINEEEEFIRPWNPGWNPRQALLDFVIPTYKYENGQFIMMTEVFAEPEIWDFPEPVGKMLVSHHAHEEPFCLPFTYAEKGLKYCDFKYYVNKQVAPIVALGLGQEEKISVGGTEVSPLDVVLSFVPNPGDEFLNEDPIKFDYADKTKIVAIMIEIIGTENGKKTKHLIDVPPVNVPRKKMYDTYGTSMISVSLPAVIGAKMAIEGTMKGVINPHEMDSERFIELMRKSGHPAVWDDQVTEV
jgi:saccharopine dehydrogenase-like NADP-dependent oxidoreductase